MPHARTALVALIVAAAALAIGCASPDPAPDAGVTDAPPASGPPPGIGRTDDGRVIGPWTLGALQVQAWRSSEAGGSVNSWLLIGEREVALIDGQLLPSQARSVVEMIQATGKPLAWVWVTHAHPDHHIGLVAVHEAFPDAPIYARPRTATDAPALFEKYKAPLNRFFPGEMPAAVLAPTPFEADTIALEGTTLRILTFTDGEHAFTTALHAPEAQALFCADLVYHDVHPWLNELHVEGVLSHAAQLEAMPDVRIFYPGHGEPFEKGYIPTYRRYVEEFLAVVPQAADSDDLVRRVWAAWPQWRTMAGLRFSAAAHIKARDAQAAP